MVRNCDLTDRCLYLKFESTAAQVPLARGFPQLS